MFGESADFRGNWAYSCGLRRPGCSHRQAHGPTSARSVSPHRQSSTASSTTRHGPETRFHSMGGCRTTRCEGRRRQKRRRSGSGTTPKRVYFAFRCLDTQPDKIRTTISRRDNAFSDDWVGVSLDSSRAGQLAYHLFVNPSGIQMDALQSGSTRRRFCARLGMAKRRARRCRRLVRGDPGTARKHPVSKRRGRAHGRAVLAPAQPHRRLDVVARDASRQMGVRVEWGDRVRRAAVAAAARDDSERNVLGKPGAVPIDRGGTRRAPEETSA